MNVVIYALLFLSYAVPILLAVAFITLLERTMLGHAQERKGPNIVGPFGLLQSFADGVKLLTKEPVRPSISAPFLFLSTPTLALMLALVMWAPIPMPFPVLELNLSVVFVLAMSSLAVYSILASGWASNSKFALVGALRAVAQTISYEVSLGLILISVIITTGTFNLKMFNSAQETMWLMIPLWPVMAMWFISTIAETNRAPFDLSEGESELVSGFNVEYTGGPFTLFFIAEYINIMLMNTLTTIMFWGTPPNTYTPELTTTIMMTKVTTLTAIFLLVRAAYPRLRYDQLMALTWKNFLPLTLGLLICNLSLITALAGLPPNN
uniref:NADH-ubiquinone oxidoreductase chain 1 n=1 Tax=Saccopharynx lavenbergi TaxID=136490 RepID=Q76MH7_9TELE|nr:NADH dehydrogenase subunits 1 [Saccopharynx lavenbergi]